MRRLFKSGFLQVTICLLAFDAILCNVVPKAVPDWYYENFSSVSYQKVLSYFNSAANPQTVLLGSSLVSTPVLISDRYAGKTVMPKREEQTRYTGAEKLEELLAEQLNRKVEVLNLAMPACMASDYSLILRKSLECGKKPALVVCATAPAEFLSNDQPVVAATMVHQGLYRYQKADDSWLSQLTPTNIAKQATGHVDFIKQMLGCGRRTITENLSEATNHPIDMNALAKQRTKNADTDAKPVWCHSLAEVADKDANGNNGFRDLKLFQKRYNPPNYKLFAEHAANFEAMLKFCHDRHVALVVVNMPITDKNKELLPPEMLARYESLLATTTSKYHTAYVDMDKSGNFTDADFFDSCHLNASGSQKWLRELAAALAPDVRTSICSKSAQSL